MKIDRRVAPVDQRLPNPIPASSRPISLYPTTTAEIGDTDIGLDPNPAAQTLAEQFVRATLAYRTKQGSAAP